ncbi:hypothetical protein GALL_17790 [mine drainage metagenome]|uniref:PAS domain-containing protein n=1 Tax=mine drainage metagenome TaxID=410659 RepID=A0A1J5T9Q3_9ZZZZ
MSSDKPSDKITTDKFDNVNFIDRREPNSIDGRRKTPYERLNLRQDAELKQAKLPVEKLPVVESFDSLVHELHVHQIELEMQNEELRRTHAALEESRDQYLSLFEFAPVGYLTLTLEGLITEANFTAADLLGMERKKLLSRPLSRHISPEDINRYHLSLSKLVRLGEKQNIEVLTRV